MPVDCIRYSEAFKQKVINEIESGKFPSRNAAKRFYGIKGGCTIRGWFKKYGKLHLTGRIIRVESVDERDQIKELKERIRTLERTLVDASCRESLAVSYFEIVCEMFNVDKEDLKKKQRNQAVGKSTKRESHDKGRKRQKKLTVTKLCETVGISRQAYYKEKKERQARETDEEAIISLIKRERALQTRLGIRKLMVLLKPEFDEMGIRIGRDKLIELCRKHGLLLSRMKRSARTTDSRHRFRKHSNKYRAADITGPNQAWLSDLMYIRMLSGFAYVSLIHDAFSRKIVGFAASKDLTAEGPLSALRMALRQLPKGSETIHHSDCGVQYCCHDYIRLLSSRSITVSMTECNHCYENAQAERLNGVMKQEYGLGETLADFAQVRLLLEQGVFLYNTRRPHMSLGYRYPVEVHFENVS